MRVTFVFYCLLLALSLQAATPEVGKDKLRRLVKLPGISFQAEWTFDPETGFTLGSNGDDKASQIKTLRKDLQSDPTDADGYLRLGTLYAELGDRGNAASARSKAVQLFRKRVDLQPEDALLLAKFGRALQAAGKTEEAESVLRHAIRTDPKEWKCWLAMGRFLDAESRHDISDRAKPVAATKSNGRSSGGPANLAPDRVALAQKRLAEAGDCFDQAVTNAPAEAEVYLRRGLHRTLRSSLLNDILEASGEPKPEIEVLTDYFSPETLADLKQASRLSTKDYQLIGNVALFEIYSMNARNGKKELGEGFDWTTLPDASQRSIRQAMTQLEDLALDPDPKVAAGALEVLSILQGPVLHETNSRLVNLRRALVLDPSREQAWEMLAGTLARAEQYEELLSTCESHLKQKDSARGHILLAKAYERLKQWDNAEDQTIAAVRQTPNDLTANLSLAALLVKRSNDASVLGEANGWLSRCDQIIAGLPTPQRPRQLVIDFTLTRSVYFALADDIDSARRWVKTVIDSDQENELAKEILAAMGY
ncbi:MAG: Tetratricopeptide 2 repeat protein [Pedosphaera sp.]|nr:Tetratricopeptide 2 repeat protein [Pedosphaera sp.]